MEIRWLGEVEPTFKSLFIPFPSVYPCGEKTPTMSGGSVMCIVDRTIIRSIWKLRMGLCSMQERASREGARGSSHAHYPEWPSLGIDLRVVSGARSRG